MSVEIDPRTPRLPTLGQHRAGVHTFPAGDPGLFDRPPCRGTGRCAIVALAGHKADRCPLPVSQICLLESYLVHRSAVRTATSSGVTPASSASPGCSRPRTVRNPLPQPHLIRVWTGREPGTNRASHAPRPDWPRRRDGCYLYGDRRFRSMCGFRHQRCSKHPTGRSNSAAGCMLTRNLRATPPASPARPWNPPDE